MSEHYLLNITWGKQILHVKYMDLKPEQNSPEDNNFK